MVNAEVCQMCLNTYPQAGDLVNAFHLPVKEAAQRRGMPLPKFQTLCRKRGINRWPFQRFCTNIVTAPVIQPVGEFVSRVMYDLAKCLADPPRSPEDDLRARPEVKS